MTLRSLMFDACSPYVDAFQRECGGSVVLTPEHLAMDRDELLAEAAIGCSQKCGCREATAEVVDGVVKARCRRSVLELDERVAPEPDVPRRKR